jgi:hypothetical protein
VAKARLVLEVADWKPGAGGIHWENGWKLTFTTSTTIDDMCVIGRR